MTGLKPEPDPAPAGWKMGGNKKIKISAGQKIERWNLDSAKWKVY